MVKILSMAPTVYARHTIRESGLLLHIIELYVIIRLIAALRQATAILSLAGRYASIAIVAA